jgi:hypothetical protein
MIIEELKKKKWFIARMIVFGWIILSPNFDGETISEISNIDCLAFCIITPVVIGFGLFGLNMVAGSKFCDKDWVIPNINSSPLDFKNTPTQYFDIGNLFCAYGFGAIIHSKYYDKTVFWVIAVFFGIGVGLYTTIFLSKVLLKWRYRKV